MRIDPRARGEDTPDVHPGNGFEQQIMNKTLLLCGLTMLLAACADNVPFSYDPDANYLIFNHPFTDKALADVRARAEKLCGQRKQLAIETSKVCSLTACASNYQCVDPADAAKHGL